MSLSISASTLVNIIAPIVTIAVFVFVLLRMLALDLRLTLFFIPIVLFTPAHRAKTASDLAVIISARMTLIRERFHIGLTTSIEDE